MINFYLTKVVKNKEFDYFSRSLTVDLHTSFLLDNDNIIKNDRLSLKVNFMSHTLETPNFTLWTIKQSYII